MTVQLMQDALGLLSGSLVGVAAFGAPATFNYAIRRKHTAEHCKAPPLTLH